MPVPAVNELPILCRCRADLQDGRHVILSSSQTLEEWQALSSCRATVEQKLRDAGGATQPLGSTEGHGDAKLCHRPGRDAESGQQEGGAAMQAIFGSAFLMKCRP